MQTIIAYDPSFTHISPLRSFGFSENTIKTVCSKYGADSKELLITRMFLSEYAGGETCIYFTNTIGSVNSLISEWLDDDIILVSLAEIRGSKLRIPKSNFVRAILTTEDLNRYKPKTNYYIVDPTILEEYMEFADPRNILDMHNLQEQTCRLAYLIGQHHSDNVGAVVLVKDVDVVVDHLVNKEHYNYIYSNAVICNAEGPILNSDYMTQLGLTIKTGLSCETSDTGPLVEQQSSTEQNFAVQPACSVEVMFYLTPLDKESPKDGPHYVTVYGPRSKLCDNKTTQRESIEHAINQYVEHNDFLDMSSFEPTFLLNRVTVTLELNPTQIFVLV